MAYQKYSSEEIAGFIAKEKGERFAKAVNTMLMTPPEKVLEAVLNDAKTIVDRAFENYPDKNNGDKTDKTQELPL